MLAANRHTSAMAEVDSKPSWLSSLNFISPPVRQICLTGRQTHANLSDSARRHTPAGIDKMTVCRTSLVHSNVVRILHVRIRARGCGVINHGAPHAKFALIHNTLEASIGKYLLLFQICEDLLLAAFFPMRHFVPIAISVNRACRGPRRTSRSCQARRAA